MSGRVLYVEDDDLTRELFGERLRAAGLTVVEEQLAERALDRLRDWVPDVILLDLGMPLGRMSGIEMLARLREVPERATVPVIVCSGFGDVVNRDIMARLNVAHVLSKPDIHGDDLARLIVALLRSRTSVKGSTVES